MSRIRKDTEKFPAMPDLLGGSKSPSSQPDPRISRPPSQQPPEGLISRPPSRPNASRPSFIDHEWMREEDTNISRTTETSIQLTPEPHEKNRPMLTVTSGFNAGQVFKVEERETLIGRGRDVHVRVEDSGVSRHHARIVKTIEGKHLVEDLRSTNGTFVGGRRVDRVELHSGDEVQVGPNVALLFSILDERAEQLARQLYESSTRDALTGSFNRRYFVERLASEVAYSNRHRSRLAVVLFDLDHFKRVNDTHGHLAGDEVLRAVARLVGGMIRAEDVFARYGGEEFVVLVRGIEHDNVARFAERIRRAVEALTVESADARIRPNISAGVASLHECGDVGTSESLLLLADERLYQAKNEGRNRVCAS